MNVVTRIQTCRLLEKMMQYQRTCDRLRIIDSSHFLNNRKKKKEAHRIEKECISHRQANDLQSEIGKAKTRDAPLSRGTAAIIKKESIG